MWKQYTNTMRGKGLSFRIQKPTVSLFFGGGAGGSSGVTRCKYLQNAGYAQIQDSCLVIFNFLYYYGLMTAQVWGRNLLPLNKHKHKHKHVLLVTEYSCRPL